MCGRYVSKNENSIAKNLKKRKSYRIVGEEDET
jgi:hypothetical protein